MLVGAMPAANASPGDLDPDFGGGDGQVTTTFEGGAAGRAVAVQKDGKLVVAGPVYHTTDDQAWAVARYKPGGALDPTFGTNGRVVTNLTGTYDVPFDVMMTAGGKIVVGGWAGSSAAVVRYLPDGHLDHSFSGDGKSFAHFAMGPAYGYALAKAPDAKVVLGGEVDDASGNYRWAIMRFTSGGALDPTFGGGDGKVTTNMGLQSLVSDVVVRSDGSIIATGEATAIGKTSVGIARFLQDGTLDEDFGDQGTFVDDLGEDFYPTGMVRLGDGKVVVAGPFRTSPATFTLGLVRFRANGHPDESFGPNGLITRDLGGTSDNPNGLVRAGTKLLVGIAHDDGVQQRIGVVRLFANGALDTGFGDQGLALGTLDEAAEADLVRLGDGRIVVVGSKGFELDTRKFLVARFLSS